MIIKNMQKLPEAPDRNSDNAKIFLATGGRRHASVFRRRVG